MSLILGATLKVSIITIAGLLSAWLLRRRGAALRHWVLSVTIVCALAAPVLEVLLPGWTLPRRTSSLQSAQSTRGLQWSTAASAVQETIEVAPPSAVERPASWPRDVSLQTIASTAWVAGAALSAIVLLIGLGRLLWLCVRARPLAAGSWPRIAGDLAREYQLGRPVRLLETDHPSLLVTCGLLRPVVIIPHAAQSWSDERIGVVLRHELAHVRRGDWIVQLAAEVLRVAYWFNPLVWLACTRLRDESEHACDDEVLSGGVDAPEYATHLLEVARLLRLSSAPHLPAPAIAHSSRLERRFRAMLDAHTVRTPATRSFRFITAAALLTATVVVAGAQSGPSVLSGMVIDATGSPVPDAAVTLTSKASGAKFEVKTDGAGKYQFVPLPADDYLLEAAYPGLKKGATDIRLSGASVSHIFALSLGTLQETITVVGGSDASRIDVVRKVGAPSVVERDMERQAFQRDLDTCVASNEGGRVRPPRKIKDVRPVYPQHLQAAGVGGAVVLSATIGTDGLVKDTQVVKSVQPELDAAAIDAVKQWRFDGTLLNCVPSEVSMTVTLNFSVK
jgi:TonB family protein